MITKRREFTKETRRQAYERSAGVCECPRLVGLAGFTGTGCGRPLRSGDVFYEHIIPAGSGGSNHIDNCAALTKTCWRKKTAWDQPTVAKLKRVRDAWRGIDGVGRPMDGSRRSRFKVHVNGAIDIRPGR